MRINNGDIYTVWIDSETAKDPTDERVIKVLQKILFSLVSDERFINTVLVRIKYEKIIPDESYSRDIKGIFQSSLGQNMNYQKIMEATATIITGKADLSEKILDFIKG